MPLSRTASASISMCMYISLKDVVPKRSISMMPRSLPARTASSVRCFSTGKMASLSQRSSVRSLPMLRSSVMGVWVCMLHRPGMASIPSPSITSSAS